MSTTYTKQKTPFTSEKFPRIYMMTGYFPLLSEQFIINQIAGLSRAHVQVHILASSLTSESSSLVQQHNMMQNAFSAGIPHSWWLRLMVGSLLLLKLLFLCPIKALKALNIQKYKTAVISLKTIYYLNLLRKHHIPLLHCHFGPIGLTGAFLKDCGIVKQLLVSFHGSDIHSYLRRHGSGVYNYLWHCADTFSANTKFTASCMEANGASSNGIRILPMGLFPYQFPIRYSGQNHTTDTVDKGVLKHSKDLCREKPSSTFTVLTVARLVEKKGHAYFLQAIASLSIPRLRYWIVGAGPLYKHLQEITHSLNIANKVTFYGAVPSHALYEYFRCCDVFVLPSITAASGDMEGQGLVLQEAQACGCPVISTLHNGIPDGVLHGKTGLLVPEKNSEALAEAMYTLANDREAIRRMGMAAAAFVRSKYDMDILTKSLLSIYTDMLSVG